MAQLADFTSTVKNGRPSMPRSVDALLRGMEGKDVHVVLENPRRVSDPMRRYYFSCIRDRIWDAFIDAGNVISKPEMHRWLKEHVGKLTKEVMEPLTGEVTLTLRSYNDLTPEERGNYHAACQAWAAERNIHIPLPGEQS